MTIGKVDLARIQKIMKKNKGIILETNRIGSDFSFYHNGPVDIIFKIEPMVYYDFLTVKENASLSLLFPMNDFLVSGIRPSFVMIDFEKPNGAGIDYFSYIDYLYKLLSREGLVVSSGHTGNYGNLRHGVCGSMALIGIGKPLFSYKRIRISDHFYLIGKLGTEYLYFWRRKGGIKMNTKVLSVEDVMKNLLEMKELVHYVHDLSEGGLLRALNELSILTKSGFEADSAKIRTVLPRSLMGLGEKIYSASSSGGVLVSVGSSGKDEFEDRLIAKKRPFAEIYKTEKGIRFDGKSLEEIDSTSLLLRTR